MKRLAALAVTSLLALSACSGGGTTATLAPGVVAPAPSKQILSAYRVPLTHSASVDAAAAAGAKLHQNQAGTRGTQGLSGMPTIDAIFAILDAPRFGAGAQVNVAILGVEAVGADGVAYSIVSYPRPVVVNLLDYKTNALVLGHNAIPNQNYTALRLVVQGSTSSLYAWGTTYPVTYGYYDGSHHFTASSSDISTVDFPVKLDTTSGAPIVLADFNTVESVKVRDGKAFFGSRIAAAPYNSSSVITGTVVNNVGAPVGSAIIAAIDSNGNVANSTMADDNGVFEIHAITGGTYQIMIYNDYTNAAGDELVSNAADSAADITGPQITVPGGYSVNIGKITD
jgi:hypothetical protein